MTTKLRYSLNIRKLPNKKYLSYIKDNNSGKNIFAKSCDWPTPPWAMKQLVDRLNEREKCDT